MPAPICPWCGATLIDDRHPPGAEARCPGPVSWALHVLAGLVVDMAVIFAIILVAAGTFHWLDRDLPVTYYPEHLTGAAVGQAVGEGTQ